MSFSEEEDDLWEFGERLTSFERESEKNKKHQRSSKNSRQTKPRERSASPPPKPPPSNAKKFIRLTVDTREWLTDNISFYDEFFKILSTHYGKEKASKMLKRKQEQTGDFNFYEIGEDGTKKLVYIVERKTPSDLVASFSDARYEIQKQKLFEAHEKEGIPFCFLIEGDMSTAPDIVLAEAIKFDLLKQTVAILQTKDQNDTVASLLLFLERLQSPKNMVGCLYRHMYAKSKRSVQNHFADSLSLIQGVGYEKALAISRAFKNVKTLVAEGKGRIRNVVVSENGKQRKIGFVLEQRILSCYENESLGIVDTVYYIEREDKDPKPKKKKAVVEVSDSDTPIRLASSKKMSFKPLKKPTMLDQMVHQYNQKKKKK
jgi:ERCC4-type nuclease